MDGEGRIADQGRRGRRHSCRCAAQPGRSGEFIAISLQDTGSGIPADRLDKIFEPFFTTKEVGKGTGLGLSQAFGFAKQSGGDIEVASTLGSGATFTIYLPRAAAPAVAAELSGGAEPRHARPRLLGSRRRGQ